MPQSLTHWPPDVLFEWGYALAALHEWGVDVHFPAMKLLIQDKYNVEVDDGGYIDKEDEDDKNEKTPTKRKAKQKSGPNNQKQKRPDELSGGTTNTAALELQDENPPREQISRTDTIIDLLTTLWNHSAHYRSPAEIDNVSMDRTGYILAWRARVGKR